MYKTRLLFTELLRGQFNYPELIIRRPHSIVPICVLSYLEISEFPNNGLVKKKPVKIKNEFLKLFSYFIHCQKPSDKPKHSLMLISLVRLAGCER